jgi:hypothetical protein
MQDENTNIRTFCWHCLNGRQCPKGNSCDFVNGVMPQGTAVIKMTEARKLYLAVEALCKAHGEDIKKIFNTKEFPGCLYQYEAEDPANLPKYPDDKNRPQNGKKNSLSSRAASWRAPAEGMSVPGNRRIMELRGSPPIKPLEESNGSRASSAASNHSSRASPITTAEGEPDYRALQEYARPSSEGKSGDSSGGSVRQIDAKNSLTPNRLIDDFNRMPMLETGGTVKLNEPRNKPIARKGITCKWFREQGQCPYGETCYYKHA